MTKYGVWIEQPGVWTGWLGFAAGGKFVPMSFDEEEAVYRANLYLQRCPAAMVSLRSTPPAELPWNEDEWRRVKAA